MINRIFAVFLVLTCVANQVFGAGGRPGDHVVGYVVGWNVRGGDFGDSAETGLNLGVLYRYYPV